MPRFIRLVVVVLTSTFVGCTVSEGGGDHPYGEEGVIYFSPAPSSREVEVQAESSSEDVPQAADVGRK